MLSSFFGIWRRQQKKNYLIKDVNTIVKIVDCEDANKDKLFYNGFLCHSNFSVNSSDVKQKKNYLTRDVCPMIMFLVVDNFNRRQIFNHRSPSCVKDKLLNHRYLSRSNFVNNEDANRRQIIFPPSWSHVKEKLFSHRCPSHSNFVGGKDSNRKQNYLTDVWL